MSEIAQSLGAGHILEGNVNRAGEKARITVQLTDARRGAKLWNVSYERDPGDVFGMQSDIVQRVASQLQATVSPQEKAAIEERPTRDLVAYALYVRGKTLIASVANAQINEKLLQAVKVLDQAIGRDPNFYLAWCQLAAAHNYIYFFGFDLTIEQARGGSGDKPSDPPGWFFVIKERPGEPRFGFQDVSENPIVLWEDVGWDKVTLSGEFLTPTDPNITIPDQTPPALMADKDEQRKDDRNVVWGANVGSAELAYILFQPPAMVAVHASEMLPT